MARLGRCESAWAAYDTSPSRIGIVGVARAALRQAIRYSRRRAKRFAAGGPRPRGPRCLPAFPLSQPPLPCLAPDEAAGKLRRPPGSHVALHPRPRIPPSATCVRRAAAPATCWLVVVVLRLQDSGPGRLAGWARGSARHSRCWLPQIRAGWRDGKQLAPAASPDLRRACTSVPRPPPLAQDVAGELTCHCRGVWRCPWPGRGAGLGPPACLRRVCQCPARREWLVRLLRVG